MPKDYAKLATYQSKRSQSFKRLYIKIALTAVILGLLSLLLVKKLTTHLNQAPIPAVNKLKLNSTTQLSAPLKQKSQKGMTAIVPRFEFYKTLSQAQEDIASSSALEKHSPKNWPYILQVASLMNKHNSQALYNRLALLGFDVFILHKDTSSLPYQSYQVCTGPYRSLKEAKEEQLRLKRDSHLSSIMIRKTVK